MNWGIASLNIILYFKHAVMCLVLSLRCTLVPCLQGHCCVCSFIPREPFQAVAVCPVLVLT